MKTIEEILKDHPTINPSEDITKLIKAVKLDTLKHCIEICDEGAKTYLALGTRYSKPDAMKREIDTCNDVKRNIADFIRQL